MAQIPERFSRRWFVLSELKGGGQSETFRVREQNTAQTLGVLKLPKNLDAVGVARFRREVEILTAIQHPAIVRLLDWSIDPSSLGYVSPCGIPLDEFWEGLAPKYGASEKYDAAYRWVRQLAEGLAVLHAKNVVHRDIKPQNIITLVENDALQPVLIDFGLAIRPEDERLSLQDGRAAANKFAAPPAAYYGTEQPTPRWDCLGLAWIFGYLVSAGEPKYARYHWQFHAMVEEDRATQVRALLAACSHPDTAPKDANAFIELLVRLRLDGGKSSEAMAPNFAAAEKGYAEGQARRALELAAERELADTSIELLQGFFDDVRRQLNQKSAANRSLPITLNHYHANAETPRIPIRELMRQAQKNVNACFFSCTCGKVAPRQFNVCAFIDYRVERPDRLPFRLYLSCRDHAGKINEQVWFLAKIDGTFGDDPRSPVSAADIVTMLLGWITSPRHWQQVD